jgi:hypothetical protein
VLSAARKEAAAAGIRTFELLKWQQQYFCTSKVAAAAQRGSSSGYSYFCTIKVAAAVLLY